MKKTKKPHFLYLVEHKNKITNQIESELKLMTEVEASHLALTEDMNVWNAHQALDMDPEMLDVDVLT